MKAGAGPLPLVPRILRRELAALYAGMSATTFDTAVRAGEAPRPVQMTGAVKGWDRHDLDSWIEARKEAQAVPVNPWDEEP